MSEKLKGERPGGLWDWPTGVIIGGVFLVLIMAAPAISGEQPAAWIGVGLGVVLGAFGVLSLMIRRGAFRAKP